MRERITCTQMKAPDVPHADCIVSDVSPRVSGLCRLDRGSSVGLPCAERRAATIKGPFQGPFRSVSLSYCSFGQPWTTFQDMPTMTRLSRLAVLQRLKPASFLRRSDWTQVKAVQPVLRWRSAQGVRGSPASRRDGLEDSHHFLRGTRGTCS